ncbi:MAG: PAS domain-containing protein [Candidatus Aureabacteria bacterium]|nr:PAS domain-containing protein [Candidatus Auribacterota bacterium]
MNGQQDNLFFHPEIEDEKSVPQRSRVFYEWIDEFVVSDLEDSAFKLGVTSGLSFEGNPSEAFLFMAQEFLEFFIPEIKYSGLAYHDLVSGRLLTFTPYSDFNFSDQLLGFLKKESGFLSTDPIPPIFEISLNRLGPIPPEYASVSFLIPVEMHFQAECPGTLLVASANPYNNYWHNKKAEPLFIWLCQIILKVSRLVYSAEKNLSVLIDHMGDGIILLSLDRQIKLINPAAKKFLGLPQSLNDNLKAFILSIFTPLLNEFDQKAELISREMHFNYPVERILKIDMDELKGTKEVLIMIRDVSHYKEVDRLKTEIISTVSHELRTPLTAIDSMVNNLMRGIAGPLSEKISHYVERIKSNTVRLSSLINNLLDLSKLEAGEVVLRRHYDDLPRLLQHVADCLEEKMKVKNIDCSIRIQKGIRAAFADFQKLDQVFINLIGNAIKFVPEGGKILVYCEKRSDGWAVHVIDNGDGIPSSDQDILFKKFKQVNRTYGAGEKGTGLGLAICSEIIKLHGGHISLHSPPESGFLEKKGCEFIVHFPDFSEKEAFQEMIKDRMRELSREKKSMALVKIIFRKHKDGLDETRKTRNNAVKILSEIIKKGTDEVAFFPKAEKLFLMIITDPAVVPGVLARIKKEMSKKLKNTMKTSPSAFRFSTLIYPQNITEVEGMFSMWEDEING